MNDPIRHMLVLANPSTSSFDHAIARTYREAVDAHGQEIVVRDLYGMWFDPIMRAEERPTTPHWAPAPDVAEELELLRRADILVLVYPIWFGTPPAMLKGYVERVLGAGYTFRDMQDQKGQAVLRGKPLLSFSTSGTDLGWLGDRSQVTALREIFDVYLWRGFAMRSSEHVMIDNVMSGMSHAYAAEQLARVRSVADRTCSALATEE